LTFETFCILDISIGRKSCRSRKRRRIQSEKDAWFCDETI